MTRIENLHGLIKYLENVKTIFTRKCKSKQQLLAKIKLQKRQLRKKYLIEKLSFGERDISCAQLIIEEKLESSLLILLMIDLIKARISRVIILGYSMLIFENSFINVCFLRV